MNQTITQEKLRKLLSPDNAYLSLLAWETEQYYELTNKALYNEFVPFSGEYPETVRPAPFWAKKAGMDCMIQESYVAEEQRSLKVAAAKCKLILMLRTEKRISDDMRNTLIKIVESNDNAGMRAVVEIIEALRL
ncbi:hypothetical protein SAMN05421823_10392 [Catalinimonas alkaloidigena]|uniref:Uncharacterized protein n=1 Tax=Catalinimonas alkaloidigena TaxID=1075417 RepID=A0A1G9DDX5_9BACT|nr:hypothetical protein [Catalinimonas alkaloidigena]SDK62040.1 hypothetical protein SAMN05421823_10392 [Catalinimonas alkaloidigena]